jgi:DNA end-binding protein Ku
MSARSIWTGTLSFGLVSFGVKAYKATDEANAETAMHQFHGACSHPINQKTVCLHCNADVAYSDIVKGITVGTTVVLLTKDELDSIKPATADAIVVEGFIPATTIDPLYVDASYFLAPEKGQQEAFVLMHAAMVEQGKAAQARLTIYGRERIVTIRTAGSGLVLQLMRSKNEVRDMADLPTYIAPGAVTVKAEMLALANQVIGSMTVAVPDYTAYEDGYAADWKALVASKSGGAALPVKTATAKAPAGDLMEQLKASLSKAAPKVVKTPKALPVAKATKAKKAKAA